MNDQPTQKTKTRYEIPVPTRGELVRNLEKTAKTLRAKKSPLRRGRPKK